MPDYLAPTIGIVAHAHTVHRPFGALTISGAVSAYVDAIRGAGGLPILLPTAAEPESHVQLDRVDGVLLTGGADLSPVLDADRDVHEIALTRAAVALRRPLLAVCRGLQVVNVAFGGSLQHEVPRHLDPEWRHALAVEEDSCLAGLVARQQRPLVTGSLHHQAVDVIGTGLRVVARAVDDGTVEAIEAVNAPVLGVQWHPELEPGPESAAIFGWLVAESRRTAPCISR